MLNCPTSYTELSRTGSTLNFVTFEMKDVDNFGKGKPYKTLVKVATPLDYYQFLHQFRLFSVLSDKLCSQKLNSNTSRAEFSSYAEHIVAAWFLRSTKLELLNKQSQLRHFITMISDFGENILVTRKNETSDQFFHRLQICLFGTVCILPSSLDENKTETVSHIITSDYK